jgi:hypothetical protein
MAIHLAGASAAGPSWRGFIIELLGGLFPDQLWEGGPIILQAIERTQP